GFAEPIPSLRSGKAFDYPGLDALKTPASFAGGGLQRTQRDGVSSRRGFAEPIPSLRSGKAFDYPGLDALKTPASFAGGGLQRTQRDSNP
ncbi:MAG: hypothetical protein IJI71_02695, partial [Clostridia bacterium]|nr:hypothetical protein [Clostridia bacterium]